MAELYARHEPSLDILVRNAGVDVSASGFADYPEEAWNDVMDFNIRAPFFLTQALLPALKAAGQADRPAKVINQGYQHRLDRRDQAERDRCLCLIRIEVRADLHDPAAGGGTDRRQHRGHLHRPGAFPSDMNEAARDKADLVAQRIPAQRIGGDREIQGAAIYLASQAGY